MGYRYATAKEDREYAKKSPEEKDKLAKQFRDNPGNAYKEGSAGDKAYKKRSGMGKGKRALLGGSGGT